MRLFGIKVVETGEVFLSDMSCENDTPIIELHFCTSYTEAVTQTCKGDGKWITKSFFLPTNQGSNTATENIAEWIQEQANV